MEQNYSTGRLGHGRTQSADWLITMRIGHQSLLLLARVQCNRRQHTLYAGALAFQPGRQLERLTQRFDRLIQGKARRISGDLEQNTARLAKVDGVKVGAVK